MPRMLHVRCLCILLAISRASSITPWTVDTSECALNIPQPLQPHGRFGCPLPIDDSVAPRPSSWSPWTHHPDCVNATNPPSTKYCVYTNSRHGIEGISLVTTPQNAADSVEILNEPVFADDHSTGRRVDLDPPYNITDVPGKGKGVVATQLIRQYETVMLDYASILVDMGFPSAVKREQGYRLLHSATDQLANPNRVLKLGRSSAEAENIIEDVLRTNAFHADLAGTPHMALYPLVSRINHACRPNSFPRFMPRSLSVTVAASRDIQPGEEITITYLTAGQTFVERQEGLKRWGFSCSCPLCSASAEEVSRSDTNRLKIQTKRNQAVEAFQAGNKNEAVALTFEIIDLLEEEDLFQLYSEQLENLGRIHWASGDKETGRMYARKSLALLEQQGYVKIQPIHLKMLLKSFEEDMKGLINY